MSAEITGPYLDSYVGVESSPEEVAISAGNKCDRGPAWLTPTGARELAAALLRAADEAEGREPAGAERDLLDFFERTGWDGTALVAAHRQHVRDEVAGDLEQMDGTNLGMSLNRTQAVRVARTGLKPMDVRRTR
ncbi:hypothetical protein ACGFZB_28930 [Streptomyces cinerochromogenes]|uniref:Uncharacterized protein n=1 Tax=Streptomyces cinerochromogenes TaxID=66422 RepID=A0ABW7BF42_9ACTN